MDFWEKVKKDLKNGINEGLSVVKDGVEAIKGKADELTTEGKKQIRIMQLKAKVHGEISELGGKVYSMRSTDKNPLLNNSVKAIMARIKKMEDEISKLEGKTAPRKKSAGKSRAKKPGVAAKPAVKLKAAAKKSL